MRIAYGSAWIFSCNTASSDTLETSIQKIQPAGNWGDDGRLYAAVGRKFFFEKYALPRAEQQDDNEDKNSEFRQYSSRTKIGARQDIIIALYGQVTPYTEYKYGWVDSVIKQTVMLCDKSGLRKKNTIPPDPNRLKHEYMQGAELKSALAAFGIGTAAEETDEQKADRIREKIQNDKRQ